jgi:hypothetical protein
LDVSAMETALRICWPGNFCQLSNKQMAARLAPRAVWNLFESDDFRRDRESSDNP